MNVEQVPTSRHKLLCEPGISFFLLQRPSNCRAQPHTEHLMLHFSLLRNAESDRQVLKKISHSNWKTLVYLLKIIPFLLFGKTVLAKVAVACKIWNQPEKLNVNWLHLKFKFTARQKVDL